MQSEAPCLKTRQRCSSIPPTSEALGPYTHILGPAEAVAIDASDAGVRVHTPDSPALMGFLTAVTPGELSHVVLAALAQGKRALPPLPKIMPQRRDGWLLDASRQGIHVWSQAADKAAQIEPAFFFAAVELYARFSLQPWEGRLAAAPGDSLEGRAPAWVEGLRIAHIELLTVLRRFDIQRMQPASEPVERPRVGSYHSPLLKVLLSEKGVCPDDPLMTDLFEGRLPHELPAMTETVLFGGSLNLRKLPAHLGGRPETRLLVGDDQARIEHRGSVDRQVLLACLDLDLRWATAPFSGKPVTSGKRPGAPPWVGKARYLLGLTAGRLMADRLHAS